MKPFAQAWLKAVLAVVALAELSADRSQAAGEMRRAQTLPAAQEMAKKSPGDLVVVVIGSDWNAASKTFKADVIDSAAFQKAFGDEVILVEIDRPENDPDGSKTALYKGPNDLRREVFVVPLIGLYDAAGRDFGQLTLGLEKLPPADVAKRIRELIALRQKRDRLWKQADQATGAKRAELLGQGLAAIAFGWGRNDEYRPRRNEYQPILDEIKKADPQGSTGWTERFSFDPDKMFFDLEELWKKNQHAEAVKQIDAMLRNKTFTPEYRQRTLALKYAVYTRWPGHEKESLAVLKQIEDIDSKSFMGLGAHGWTKYLTGPVDLDHGWRKHNVKAAYSQWNINIAPVLREPGFYRLKLEQAGGVGKNNIVVGGMKIDVKGRTVWTYGKEVRPTFEDVIELPAAGTGKAVLTIQAKGDGGTDAYGSITLEPFYLKRAKE